MKVHIIDHNSTHLSLISKLVTDFCDGLSSITFAKTHDDHSQYLKDLDLIIISGGTWLVNLNPGTHRRLINLLIATEKPIFGICLGAEALAYYFSSELVHLSETTCGIQTIKLMSELQNKGLPSSLEVFEYHSWSIENLGKSLVPLALNGSGVEAFRHKKLPIWGTQFHPEARREFNKGYLVFEEFLKQNDLPIRPRKQ